MFYTFITAERRGILSLNLPSHRACGGGNSGSWFLESAMHNATWNPGLAESEELGRAGRRFSC